MQGDAKERLLTALKISAHTRVCVGEKMGGEENKCRVFLSDSIQTRLRKFRKNPLVYFERTISKSIDFLKRGYSLLSLVN